jgi:hypothetical protein
MFKFLGYTFFIGYPVVLVLSAAVALVPGFRNFRILSCPGMVTLAISLAMLTFFACIFLLLIEQDENICTDEKRLNLLFPEYGPADPQPVTQEEAL